MLKIQDIVQAHISILSNTRAKGYSINRHIKLQKDYSSYEFVYKPKNIRLYGLFGGFYSKLHYPNNSKLFKKLMKETPYSIDLIDSAFTITRSLLSSFFVRSSDIEHYENDFLQTFFMIQSLNSNSFHEYNVSQLIRYSYTDAYIWRKIKVEDQKVYLYYLHQKMELLPIIKKILANTIKDKAVFKTMFSIFEQIICPKIKMKINFDFLNDDLCKYIINKKHKLEKNPQKYCDVLIQCMKRNQCDQNILVSKMILNGFLHHTFSKSPHFLIKHKEKLVKASSDEKILDKMHYVLYNLNQVKPKFWQAVDLKKFKVDPKLHFYKYNLTYGYRDQPDHFSKLEK